MEKCISWWDVGINSCYLINGYNQKTPIFIVLDQKSFVQHINTSMSDVMWLLWTDKEMLHFSDPEAEE